MKKRIADDGRTGWLDEEYAKSNDPNTYVIAPQDAWRRLKSAICALLHCAV